MPFSSILENTLVDSFGIESGTTILVAFSGGPDSTALLWGLSRLAPHLDLDLHAAHFDHRLDADSPRRAQIASGLASRLGVPFHLGQARGSNPTSRGLEAQAREERYRFLGQRAEEIGARFIATAHHADDQAETVLLRLAFGSGVEGLAAIRPRHGRVIRPVLNVRRKELLQALQESGLAPAMDPTNRNLERPRNRLRHLVLPRLMASEGEQLVSRLCRVARKARTAGRRLDEIFARQLRVEPWRGGWRMDRVALGRLPEHLWPYALAVLHRREGVPYPAGHAARDELRRQILSGHRIGCDCGGGWRWEGDARHLRLQWHEPGRSHDSEAAPQDS